MITRDDIRELANFHSPEGLRCYVLLSALDPA